MDRLTVAALLALSLSEPVAAKVVASTDTAFVTRSEVVVEAAPASVWSDLVVPAKWWDPEHTWSGQAANLSLEPRAGGCFCELLGTGEPGAPRGSVEHLHVVQVLSGRLLRMTGGLGPLQSEPVGAVFTITLASAGEGTRIGFEYKVSGLVTIKGGDIVGAVDGVLSAQLARLAALARGSGSEGGASPRVERTPAD